jgi:hypothetical protein
MDYQSKYLKYKKKYLNLKNKIEIDGGSIYNYLLYDDTKDFVNLSNKNLYRIKGKSVGGILYIGKNTVYKVILILNADKNLQSLEIDFDDSFASTVRSSIVGPIANVTLKDISDPLIKMILGEDLNIKNKTVIIDKNNTEIIDKNNTENIDNNTVIINEIKKMLGTTNNKQNDKITGKNNKLIITFLDEKEKKINIRYKDEQNLGRNLFLNNNLTLEKVRQNIKDTFKQLIKDGNLMIKDKTNYYLTLEINKKTHYFNDKGNIASVKK